MNPLILRFLLNMYVNQSITVRWNGSYSEPFNVSNRVRKGGVVSPVLFTVYMDELIEKLKKEGIGCHMGRHYCGILGFADDIMLLCPTLDGLRKMIKICEDYANSHSILFNGLKSKLLIYGKYDYDIVVNVNNENVPICTDAEYLGIMLYTKYEDKYEYVIDGASKFNASFNYCNAIYRSCYSFVKYKLFVQNCGSLYGSQLWPLWHSNMQHFYTQWRKAVRKIMWISPRTHCRYLPLITDSVPVEILSYKRFLNFYNSMKNSDNNIVKYLANTSRYCRNSTMGKNVNYLLYKCNIDIEELNCITGKQFVKLCVDKWISDLMEEDFINANLIRDMINVRDGYYDLMYIDNSNYINLFDREQCNTLLNYLCTA